MLTVLLVVTAISASVIVLMVVIIFYNIWTRKQIPPQEMSGQVMALQEMSVQEKAMRMSMPYSACQMHRQDGAPLPSFPSALQPVLPKVPPKKRKLSARKKRQQGSPLVGAPERSLEPQQTMHSFASTMPNISPGSFQHVQVDMNRNDATVGGLARHVEGESRPQEGQPTNEGHLNDELQLVPEQSAAADRKTPVEEERRDSPNERTVILLDGSEQESQGRETYGHMPKTASQAEIHTPRQSPEQCEVVAIKGS